jgi:hypothetical protein
MAHVDEFAFAVDEVPNDSLALRLRRALARGAAVARRAPA